MQMQLLPAAPQGEVTVATIQHYSHPKHPLARISVAAGDGDVFVCDGCKEYGAGKRYACQQCDYQLHDFCATSSPPAISGHPLHPQHQLIFHSRPNKQAMSWPKCHICGKSNKGFCYRCRACSFHMHPCCALLSTHILFPPPSSPPDDDDGDDQKLHHKHHPLRLLPPGTTPQQMMILDATSSANATAAQQVELVVLCGECKGKISGGGGGGGRIYRCTLCNYHLHAACAKSMINGLRAYGIATTAPPPNKSSSMGIAARLASQVVIEFIAALVQGLGEGVGQVLVQDIANVRGRRRRPTRSQTPPT